MINDVEGSKGWYEDEWRSDKGQTLCPERDLNHEVEGYTLVLVLIPDETSVGGTSLVWVSGHVPEFIPVFFVNNLLTFLFI